MMHNMRDWTVKMDTQASTLIQTWRAKYWSSSKMHFFVSFF